MNKFIKEQLSKCRIYIPEWDDDTTHIIIPSINHYQPTLDCIKQLDGLKQISIKDYIINEPSNFTLSANWNRGTKPPEHDMQVEILESRGKMIKVSGEGMNTHIHWEGWLPQKGFEIVQ